MTAALAALDPIGLDELTERAALQTRVDRKYVLGTAELERLLDRLPPGTRVLQIGRDRAFRYESVYFDTPELASYRLAAHRRRHRFKIRTRTYVESSLCWLEVKTCGPRGSTVKHRLPYRPDDRTRLDPGRAFVDAVLDGRWPAGAGFAPTLVTAYRRSTLLLPATPSRATVDTDLTWCATDGRRLRLAGRAVVETKCASGASQLDRLLWTHGHRPVRISKYATGLAALYPGLPAAPWTRTLRRHFTVPPTPSRTD
ncbi:polyphosphate polymerase domain-containing protein [Dactylosporangium sp. NPDC050688]|uniref:polyphosphate polymerase domain-containing protein n=1 Tax=Dactylosporangium sp. NPDC050688 TaxID=3157217 RepID=UPI0033E5CD44